MDKIILNHLKKALALTLTLCAAVSLFAPLHALADAAPVGYMPGVTEAMTDPAFWFDLTDDPDALLATAEDIARINQAAIFLHCLARRSPIPAAAWPFPNTACGS